MMNATKFNLTPTLIFQLCDGANMTGSFSEGVDHHVESMYMHEIDEIREFCTWIDEEVGGASKHNIDMLYRYWNGDASLKSEVQKIKDKIAYIKSLS